MASKESEKKPVTRSEVVRGLRWYRAGLLALYVSVLALFYSISIVLDGIVWHGMTSDPSFYIPFPIGLVSVVFSILCCANNKFATIARRWQEYFTDKKLNLFPENDAEREGLRRGFAVIDLKGRAKDAQQLFSERDAVENVYLNAKELHDIKSGKIDNHVDMNAFRHQLARFRKDADKDEAVWRNLKDKADQFHKSYLVVFDFLRDLDLVPIHPVKDKAFIDAGEFFKWANSEADLGAQRVLGDSQTDRESSPGGVIGRSIEQA